MCFCNVFLLYSSVSFYNTVVLVLCVYCVYMCVYGHYCLKFNLIIMTIMMIVGRKACVYWSATAAVKDGCHAHVDCHFDRGIVRRGAAAVGRFVHLYCSLG